MKRLPIMLLALSLITIHVNAQEIKEAEDIHIEVKMSLNANSFSDSLDRTSASILEAFNILYQNKQQFQFLRNNIAGAIMFELFDQFQLGSFCDQLNHEISKEKEKDEIILDSPTKKNSNPDFGHSYNFFVG